MPRMEAASIPPWSSRVVAASRMSSSVSARRGPGRRRSAGADLGSSVSLDVTLPRVDGLCTPYKFWTASRDGSVMTFARSDHALRRTTGALFVGGALAFAGAATVLSATFDWPDVLREPA